MNLFARASFFVFLFSIAMPVLTFGMQSSSTKEDSSAKEVKSSIGMPDTIIHSETYDKKEIEKLTGQLLPYEQIERGLIMTTKITRKPDGRLWNPEKFEKNADFYFQIIIKQIKDDLCLCYYLGKVYIRDLESPIEPVSLKGRDYLPVPMNKAIASLLKKEISNVIPLLNEEKINLT